MRPRRKPTKGIMGSRDDSDIRCRAHLAWIRGHNCLVPGCTSRQITAAHVRDLPDGTPERERGGTGKKPADWHVVPLCILCHRLQHAIGEAEFCYRYKINMAKTAAELARASPHIRKLREASK